MKQLPFQLEIENSYSGQKETVECRAVLRSVPGTRDVFDAVRQGKPVIVKIFLNRLNAPRHIRKEWRGLNRLQRLQINSPSPVFFGRTDDGQWALVIEKITNSFTAVELFDRAGDYSAKLGLISLVCRELARQNEAGILQKDLHLGNFLVRDNEVYAIDPARMRFLDRPLTRSESISQLALLACCLPDEDRWSQVLSEQYFFQRRWKMEKKDELLLKKKIASHRKKIIRKSLEKTLRTSRRYEKIEDGRYTAVFNKSFVNGGESLVFLGQIDSLMDAGQILKKGNTCYVSAVVWNGRKVVVKRYNHKGFIHSLQISFKGSRAKHSWLCGHLLDMLGVATPKPLVFIEQRKGLLLWKSYLVTEYVPAQKLCDFLQDDRISGQEKKEMMEHISQLLEKLGEYRITHGDLKFTNILVSENGLVLTDLDSMQRHKWKWTYKIRQARDTKNPILKKFLVLSV